MYEVYDYLRDMFEYTCTNESGQQFSNKFTRGLIQFLIANLGGSVVF